MKDFLDVLQDEMHQPRSQRDEAMYISRLKALAATAPPLRKIPSAVPLRAETLIAAPDSRFFQTRPDVELFFYEFAKSPAEPRWFRDAKAMDRRVFARWDALQNEAQVLETIAMGADLYCLDVHDHDAATLQYLVEVGVDYEVSVFLRCANEEDLARALFVEADCWIAPLGAVAVPELLEMPIFRDRKVLMPAARATLVPHHLKQMILHFEREEPSYD